MKKWKKLASAAMAAMMCAALLTGCGGEKKQADYPFLQVHFHISGKAYCSGAAIP